MKYLNNKPIALCRFQNTIGNRLGLMVLGLLLMLSTACNNSGQKKETQNTTVSKIQRVEVVSPKQRSFTAEVLITGTAHPNQTVMLYAMESGMLSQIRKDIGDPVKKGETIAVLDNPELRQQQLRLQAELNGKKSIYERLKSVHEKTPALTNIQMVENAEAEYLSIKAQLAGINDRIGFLTVKAPFSGTVTQRFVDNGSLIQSGLNQSNPQAIVEIQETDPIRVTLPIPESDAVGIKKGMDVQITFPELSSVSIQAKISRISNALDARSKTMQVEIDLNNKDGKIVSGMYAKALLQINSRENILSLPIISKISHKNEDYVLAVENNTVKRVPVTIGLSDKDYFEVLNAEITESTQVIVSGKGLVNDGQKVEPIVKEE